MTMSCARLVLLDVATTFMAAMWPRSDR